MKISDNIAEQHGGYASKSSTFFVTVCTGTAHRHLFRAAGKFCECQVKACTLNAPFATPLCFLQSTE